MFAIVQSGSKQYKVAPGDVIKVEKLNETQGAETVLNSVMLIYDKELHLGAPYLDKAGVLCDVLEQDRDPKITIFKYKRRKGGRVKKGHRQAYTLLKVKEIALSGLKAAPTKKVSKSPAKKVPPKTTKKKGSKDGK
jgi:large subunit ribosomal protein L21